MKFKTSLSLTIAIVLGLITAKVGLDMISKQRGTSGGAAKVVIAKKDMEPGYVVDAADVSLEIVPARLVGARTIKDPKLVVGRTITASVMNGYPLSDAVLAPEGAGAGVQAMLPAGMRAVTVDVSESSGVAGLLTPGCKVDVIATLRRGEETIAKTIVQNVKVQFVQRGKLTRASQSAGSDAGPVKTVTLIVTPKEAATIELANAQGKPRLVLRGNADTGDNADNAVSQNELLGIVDEPKVEAPPPPVAPQPTDVFSDPKTEAPKGRVVEVFRGGDRSTITYDEDQGKEGNGATPAAGKDEKSAGDESRNVSGAAPGHAPRTDAGRGTLRKGN